MEETMGAVRAGRSTIGKRLEAETFLEPLDFFLGEHLRQHAICAALDAIVLNPRHDRAREEIGCILTYLNEGLPLHLSDEEEDLFPLLEQRCLPADRVDEVLRLLRSEHEKDGELAEEEVQRLEKRLGVEPLAYRRPPGSPGSHGFLPLATSTRVPDGTGSTPAPR
jgi:hypothetical protein